MKKNIDLSSFETPGTIRQVESHLIFGPISRRIPLGYLIMAAGAIGVLACLFTSERMVEKLDNAFFFGFMIFTGYIILPATKRQQAIMVWWATKLGIGIAAFIMATVGMGTGFQHSSMEGWTMLALGLIWIPGIEFIPKVTPYQKYLTLARIVLSIPCIYLGVQTGDWHWD